METFYAKNYAMVETLIDDLDHSLGQKKTIMEFVIEDAISDAVEVAGNIFTIDGNFPTTGSIDVEIKHKSSIIEMLPYTGMPECLRKINRRLRGVLSEYQYRGFFSPQCMVVADEGKAYLSDPCCRAGSPPAEMMQAMVSNWADILWEGADGIVVEPALVAKFGAELCLYSNWAATNWQPISFPASIKDHVKLYNHAVIDGNHYCVPDPSSMPEIGNVVMIGDTLEEAIEQVCRIAEKVEGHALYMYPDSFDEAMKQYRVVKSLDD